MIITINITAIQTILNTEISYRITAFAVQSTTKPVKNIL